GEWDKFFIALMKERLLKDGLDVNNDLFPQLRAHMNRGAISLYDRVKSLDDFQDLLPQETRI
ncbi:MAG: DndE family protein, partial [Candidatus Bathyarchaeota archaeon]|nr:DndE family protein [Candidatus Bathyarchaeota archaeon]